MKITTKLYDKLVRHCSTELLSVISIELTGDECRSIWEIPNELVKGPLKREIIKIAFIFEKYGGQIFYNGLSISFDEFSKTVDEHIGSILKHYWEDARKNGDCPIYDLGMLPVLGLYPKYSARPQEDGSFVIEKRVFGELKPIKGEVYYTEADAKARAEKLNKDEIDFEHDH